MNRRLSLISLIAIAVAATACGSSSSSGSSSAPATAMPAATSTSAAGSGTGKTVNVTLKDFSITLAGGDSLKPGTYTFDVSNQGPSSHNLTIEGPGVSNAATPTFPSGQTKQLTVTLKKGAYDFFCSVPGHKQAGMNADVTVGSGGSSAMGSGGGSSSSGGGSSASGGGWG